MTEQKNKIQKSHISILLRAAVALIACALIAKNLDFNQFWKKFSTISPLTAVGVIVIFMLSQVLLSLRWWILMRALDICIQFRMGVKLTFLGLYFNNFMPGSVGGDLVRAWYVAKNTHKRMASIVSVLADRVLALFGTLIMAGVAFWLAGSAEMLRRHDSSQILDPLSKYKDIIIITCLIFVAAGIAILTSFMRHKKLKPIYDKLLQYLRNTLRQAIDAGLAFLRKPLLFPTMMTLTFVLQSMVIFSLWLLGREMKIPADWGIYFVVFPLTWIAGAIPVSVAGIGVVEGGVIYLLMHFGGASYDAAAALALSQRAVWVIASLPGVGIYLCGKHLPNDTLERFSIDANH